MPPTPLQPGDPRQVGRFTLLGRLGEGGQGVVYLGSGTGAGEGRVAVKVLRSSADAEVLQRLARELAAVHNVQPFVTARVIEAGTDAALRYVASEFIDGPSLLERVKASGPLAEGELLRLAAGTATALTAIHGAGVVHRDFKPANVLLGPDGPRVVDFGIARLIDEATITSGVIGTPAYMAPEQLAGARVAASADIFAWAATIGYAATGRQAFGADTVPAVMHRILYGEPDLAGVPPSLAPLLEACLSKLPERRPAAREVLLAIADPSGSQPRLAGRDSQSPAGAAGGPVLAAAQPSGQGPAWSQAPVPGAPAFPAAGPAGGWPVTAAAQPPLSPRRRRRALAAGGVALLVAFVAAVAVLVARGVGSPGATAGRAPGSSPPASAAVAGPSPAATPAATPAGSAGNGPLIPAAFAGTWAGTAEQSLAGVQVPDSVSLKLLAGSRTAYEVNQGCVNTLTLTTVTATVLTFNEPAVPGSCVGGTVTLTRAGSALAYHWTDGTEVNAGDLDKSS